MQIDLNELQGKKILISGIHQTGKTYVAQILTKDFPSVAVYTRNDDDIQHYWDRPNTIVIKAKNPVGELDSWCRRFKDWATTGLKVKEGQIGQKLSCIVIDDADVLFKTNFDTAPNLRDLWANQSHMNLTIVMISHRLQDIPARLYGQVEMMIFFPIESPQTIDLLNKMYAGLGDSVSHLEYGSHKFIVKKIGEPPSIPMAIA